MLQILILYVADIIFRCCDGLPKGPMGNVPIGRLGANNFFSRHKRIMNVNRGLMAVSPDGSKVKIISPERMDERAAAAKR